MPMVVFATAYDRFALDAFRVSACDYLLKPFDDARFGEALTKVMSRSSSSSTVLMESLRTLLTHTSTAPSKHLVVKVNGRHVFVDSDSIIRIEASGKEVRLHTTRFVQVVREGLTSIGERLDTATFIRVHRSAIVNRTHITEVQPWFRGEYVIVMKDGSKLTSGRHYQHVIRQLLQRA
jgi:two-component system LytT family response regulator